MHVNSVGIKAQNNSGVLIVDEALNYNPRSINVYEFEHKTRCYVSVSVILLKILHEWPQRVGSNRLRLYSLCVICQKNTVPIFTD